MNARRLLFGIAQCGLIVVLIFQLQVSITTAQELTEDQTQLSLEPVLRFTHLNSDDGLIQNSVDAILQDRNGFMWFGTQAGLSRYDGYRFISFQHDPDNPNSLTHNDIRDLYEDRDGMIWIATEGGGINRLDPNTMTFTSYMPPPDQKNDWNGIVGDRHSVVFQDSRGHIWAGGPRPFGLSDFDPTQGTALVYYPGNTAPDGFMGTSSEDIIETEDHQLWIAARFAIDRYDPVTRHFAHYDLRHDGELHVVSLLETSNGQVWAGGARGLYRFNIQADHFDRYPVPASINDILEAENGLLWLATDDGIYRFDPQSEQIVGHDVPYAGVADSLNNISINELYQDRSGLIWIAGENGLDVYDPQLARFDYFRDAIPGAPSSFVAGQIQSMYVSDQNTAWIGVNSVLHKVNLDTKTVTLYRLEDYGLDTGQITSIVKDHIGKLWLGDDRGNLLQFDPIAEVFSEYEMLGDAESTQQSPGSPPSQHTIVGLHEDTHNNLWIILNQGGIYRLDEARETFEKYKPPAAARPLGGGGCHLMDGLSRRLRV